jgi:hypothetical protein
MPAAIRHDRGSRLGGGESLRLGLASMARGFAPSLAVAACVAVGHGASAVLGLLVDVVLLFTVAVAVTDDRHPRFAIRRSASLVNRRGATMLGLLLALGLANVGAVLAFVFAFVFAARDFGTAPAILVATLMNDVVATALQACLVTTAYCALRRDEEPPSDGLRSVFA